jgi:hypothetical protein
MKKLLNLALDDRYEAWWSVAFIAWVFVAAIGQHATRTFEPMTHGAVALVAVLVLIMASQALWIRSSNAWYLVGIAICAGVLWGWFGDLTNTLRFVSFSVACITIGELIEHRHDKNKI